MTDRLEETPEPEVPPATRLTALLGTASARLLLVAGLFVFIVVCLLVLTNERIDILSAVRAYVAGEGLWSKAEKVAVHHLSRYAASGQGSEYEAYLRAIAVPLGDQLAREELEKPEPDLAVVHRGFIQGRNHPDDIAGMARLFRRFRHVSYLDKAIAIWTEADVHIGRLRERGEELHAVVSSGKGRSKELILDEIYGLDRRLTVLEDEFSFALGEANRWVTGLLNAVTYAGTGLLLALGCLLSWMMWKRTNASEAENARLLSELEQANRFKSDFVANLSHELRAPLNVILGYNELLLEDAYGALARDQAEVVRHVNASALEILDLMSTTLDLSRIEAKRLPLELQEFRADDLLRELVREARALPVKVGVRIEFKVASDLYLRSDRLRLKMILRNLIGNALKFTERGTVAVEALRIAEGVEIAVRDTGVGIEPEALTTIFEPFRQAHGATEGRRGAGLGLHIVQRLIDLLGGSISVESEVGRGSTFRVRIPLRGPNDGVAHAA